MLDLSGHNRHRCGQWPSASPVHSSTLGLLLLPPSSSDWNPKASADDHDDAPSILQRTILLLRSAAEDFSIPNINGARPHNSLRSFCGYCWLVEPLADTRANRQCC
jgi:hypothetical protein